MTKFNLKVGDTVVVISGKDKGKSGKIISIDRETKRAAVEGVNIITKHQKPRSQKDKGGIIKRPAPVDISNLMLYCAACGKATRVAHQEINGKKVRVCKKCGVSLDKEFVKASKKEAKKKELAETKAEANEVKEENKPAAKKTTTKTAAKETSTASTKVKKESAKASTATARRSTNRGK